MMRELLKIKKCRVYVLLTGIIYIAFSLFICLYQFPNQKLTLNIYLESEKPVESSAMVWENDPAMTVLAKNIGNYYAKNISGQSILEYAVGVWQAKEGEKCRFSFHINGTVVRFDKLTVYRNEIKLKEIRNDEMAGYVESFEGAASADLAASDTFFVDDSGELVMKMNSEFQALLREESTSFLQERVVLLLAAFILLIVFYIAGMIYIYSKNKDIWRIPGGKGITAEIIRFAMDCRKYGYYMVYSARSDLKAEVANSYLNWLWWLLEPFCNMLVYVIVFGNFMGSNIRNYAMFVFSALLMWNFFSKSVNYSVKAVRNNKEIVSKVYVPKFVILLSNMFLNFFKFLFSLIVLAVMFIFFKITVNVHILWILLIYFELFLFSFGIGMILLHFGVFIDDLSYAVSILLSMLMFLSGIFYDISTTLFEPLNHVMLYMNPIAMMISSMRTALIDGQCPDLILIEIWLIISFVLSLIGIHIIYKNHDFTTLKMISLLPNQLFQGVNYSI